MTKKRYKFRIYPNKEQEIQLKKTIGCCRYIYNWALNLKSDTYKKDKIRISYLGISKKFTKIKSEIEWLNEVSHVALQQSLRNLDSSFESFFKKRSRYPKFKKRKNGGSARFVGKAFRLKNSLFYIAKIKTPIKVAWSRGLPSIPSSCVITQNPSGQWFVGFVCEEEIPHLPKVNKRIGIDLGIETFATLSDGTKVKQPDSIRNSRRKLTKAKKIHSRKRIGSRNREKARLKLAKVHQKISNVRQDFLNKLSTSIVRENQVIAIEDLAVGGMVKNSKLSRYISEQGWREFRTMLDYKSNWYGRELVVADRFFPSSKTCSCCGKQAELTLKDRVWSCACGATHDRDVNAAKNILAVGTTVLACGTDLRLPRKRLVAKQEVLPLAARQFNKEHEAHF